jgi:hypothetical protein
MISLNGCDWLFFLWLDSHVPVKTCSDVFNTAEALTTLAIAN